MKVVILSGVPGSGKSTYAKGLLTKHPSAVICSADNYFIDKDGDYHFDPSRLSDAHAMCLRRYTSTLLYRAGDPVEVVIVDNTNTTALELAPYVALANAYKIPTYLITVECDPEVAFKRNVHGVSLEAIKRMTQNLKDRKIPPFWKLEVEFSGEVSLTEP